MFFIKSKRAKDIKNFALQNVTNKVCLEMFKMHLIFAKQTFNIY